MMSGTMCPYCNMDTGGNHELYCPVNQNRLTITPETKKQPYKCPVCDGRGVVPAGFYSCYPEYTCSDANNVPCRACKGKGIIWGRCGVK